MIRNGIDRITEYDHLLKGKRLGLITSISGVSNRLKSTIDIISRHYELTALFAPEHGVRGNIGAGDDVYDYRDPYSGIPVYSLYSKDSKRITKEMLDQVDAVIYDIQDLGVRYYTFISTMYYTMQECEKYGREVIILDRLNPLGDQAEGNLIAKQYQSFIGAYSLCMRYGLTIGELAEMIYDEQGFSFPMSVIPIAGWKRHMLFPETGNLWVMPSPGMPRFETALLYPGTCLFEGTNLSEGRGTAAPFEIIGAPYVDGYRFAAYMNAKNIPGVLFSPAYFIPSFSKHQNISCEGVHIHITDVKLLRPTELGVILLYAFRELYPDDFAFLPPFREGGRRSIELLFGNSAIMTEASPEKILESFRHDSEKFYLRKQKYHKYD